MAHAWYAVYTRFQHEKSAASLLERKDFEVFLPLYRAVHRWRDRNQSVSTPLFPCYLFLNANAERKLDIIQTAGVHWIVESAGRACEIPEGEIAALRQVCSGSSGIGIQPHPFLKRGERARIRGGPLVGTEGIFIRAKNQHRVVVSIELLRKSVSVEVDEQDVEPLRERNQNSAGPRAEAQ